MDRPSRDRARGRDSVPRSRVPGGDKAVRRARAGLGLAAILTGVPAALLLLVGPPRVPSFEASEGLSGSYVPVDAILGILGILAWTLWAYLALAVLLNVLAEVATRRKLPVASTLVAASLLLTPKVVRRLVEVAVGGVFVAASVSGSLELRSPLREAAAIATVDDTVAAATVKTPSAETPEPTAYRVRSGDSLWRIAERELGSGLRWREIFRLIKDRSFANGHRLTNAHLIYPGWDLALPAQGRTSPVLDGDGGGAPPADRGTAPEDEESIAPPPASEEGPPDGGNVPKSSPEDFAPEESEPHPHKQPAIRLPSGIVVATSFASGLLTAHLLARLRQRRGRRVTDAEPPDLSEPALTVDLRRAGASPMAGTLDVALHAVAKVWRQHRAVWPRILAALEGERLVRLLISDDGLALPPPAGGHMSPSVRFARAEGVVQAEVEGPFPALLRRPLGPLERGVLAPIGRARDGSVVHVGLVSVGTLSVGGTEAEALARQVVLACAAQGSPEDVRIIFLGHVGGLRLAETLPNVSAYGWDDAAPTIRKIQTELLRRARLFFDEGIEDVWGHLAAHADERLPGLVVVAAEPPAALRGVVEAFGMEGPSLGAGLLPLGWRPAHSLMHAEVGSVSELDLLSDLPCPRRLLPLVLDEDAAAQAVDVLLQAFPKAQDVVPLSEASESEVLLVDTPVPGDASSTPSSSGAPTQPGPPTRSDVAPVPPGEPVTLPVSDPEDWPSEPSAPGQPEVPTPPRSLVAVRCLGAFEVWRDERMLRKGWRNKAREILAYLIARPSGAPKERIVEELWPGIDPEEGSERFDRMTSELRSKVRGRDDTGRYVDKEDDVFHLEPGAWWSDAWELERLVSEAEHEENADETVRKLQEATELYRGEFCQDYYYPWAEGVRERFRALTVRACGRLADLLSDRGQHDQAIAILDQGIAADPVCEDLSRRAMAIEASLGRRAAALARYRKLEARLDAEVSVEPDPETQALAAQLQADSKAV
jgi:DNA-binding SARP family transcriptional activator